MGMKLMFSMYSFILSCFNASGIRFNYDARPQKNHFQLFGKELREKYNQSETKEF